MVPIRIDRAQLSPSGDEAERENFIMAIGVPLIRNRTKKLHQLPGNVLASGNGNLLDLLKRDRGSAGSDENCVEHGFQNDTEEDIMSDTETIAAVSVNRKMKENYDDVLTSVIDSVFLRYLRDEAAKSRVQYGRQQGVLHFFKKIASFC
ncbi:hypothetical protein TNCV_3133311 [Trichonephila clavipes]|nr:hypothetical protein TNCV_3133311 [Trichonephila clavipes]